MLKALLSEHSTIYRNFGRSAAKNLWVLVGCLLKGRTTNLNRLKDYVSELLDKPMTDPESHYKRLLRFFQSFARPDFVAAVLETAYTYLQGQSRFLLLDGSSWQIGQRKVHFLTLSSLMEGVAVPIAWQELGHWGSSDQVQRQSFLEAVSQRLDLRGQLLLADREYIGRQWLHYLQEKGIDFVIRLRMGDYVPELRTATGWSWPVVVAHALSHRQPWAIEIQLKKRPMWVVLMRNPQPVADQPLLMWITSLSDAAFAAEAYRQRWQTECLFKHLKSNGFNLQEVNLKDPNRLNLMMAVVVLAYTLSLREGLRQPAKAVKRYVQGMTYRAVSVFRQGLSRLTRHFGSLLQLLKHLLSLKSPTQWHLLKNVQ